MTASIKGSAQASQHSAPAARRLREHLDDGLDRLAGFDPGLTQLRMALQAVLGIGLAAGLAYYFVKLTGAMQIDTHGAVLPPAQAAAVAAQHHAVLIIAMLLGAMVAMVGSFVVSDPTPRGQAVTSVLIPIPMLAAMAVGMLLTHHRLFSLAYLVLALMVAVLLRRFGLRGFSAGLLVFQGAFLGFFLASALGISDIGWIAAEFYLGVLAASVVRFGVFRPHNGRTLLRMQHSWVARSRRLVDLAWQLTARTTTPQRRDRLARQLQRQLVRINESTLMIDAQLAQPGSSLTASVLHERLYDLELALSNVARFTEALSRQELGDGCRTRVRAVLAALRDDRLDTAAELADELVDADRLTGPLSLSDDDQTAQVLLHRLAGSVKLFADAQREWLAIGERHKGNDQDTAFVPAVGLFGGWLPGSAAVSARASTTAGPNRWFDRAVKPEVRGAIQVGVAAVIAISIGDVISGRRFYWGMLAVFLAFMATSNSGEQVRKALFRAGGTAVGIVIGDVGVRLTGNNTAVVFAIVLISLFIGIYLMRINYMFMVIGITVTMSQLYVQLEEFSWHLLLLRLLETGVGVGAVILTVLFVLPLRPQRVLRIATLNYFEQLTAVVSRSTAALTGVPTADGALAPTRADVRGLDAAHHALVSTATPLQAGTFGDNSQQLNKILAISTASRYYARNLTNGVGKWHGGHHDSGLRRATDELASSMEAIGRRLERDQDGVYTRSAALFDVLDTGAGSFDERLILRDFILLDAAMARLAQSLNMTVRDHDTTVDRTDIVVPTDVVAEADALQPSVSSS